MSVVQLQAKNGDPVTVDVKTAQCSLTIKTMMEELDYNIEEDSPIPLPNISERVLNKVVEWCQYHKDDPPRSPSYQLRWNYEGKVNISNWDEHFLQVDQTTLFGMIASAHYLDIKGLLDVGCTTLANMIEGKTEEELLRMFHSQSDVSADEEDRLCRGFQWEGGKVSKILTMDYVLDFIISKNYESS